MHQCLQTSFNYDDPNRENSAWSRITRWVWYPCTARPAMHKPCYGVYKIDGLHLHNNIILWSAPCAKHFEQSSDGKIFENGSGMTWAYSFHRKNYSERLKTYKYNFRIFWKFICLVLLEIYYKGVEFVAFTYDVIVFK